MFRSVFPMLVGLAVLSQPALAESIPLMTPHSGTVSSKGAPFNGQGHFRFAIINGDLACQSTSPVDPCKSFWSSDDTSSTGEMPDNALTIPVSNGQFSVKLGGATPLNEIVATQMPALNISVFNTPTTYLRVWFDDGTNGPQLLSPDRQLVAVPYAYRAEIAEKVIRKIARTHFYHKEDGTDEGPLPDRILTFVKTEADTAIRVTYTDGRRCLGHDVSCRWEIRFNGASCVTPGLLAYDIYIAESAGASIDHHRNQTTVGTCFGLPAGTYVVQVYVGAAPGRPVSDAHTGWQGYTALEAEEVR